MGDGNPPQRPSQMVGVGVGVGVGAGAGVGVGVGVGAGAGAIVSDPLYTRS